jgi:hypothetical protein
MYIYICIYIYVYICIYICIYIYVYICIYIYVYNVRPTCIQADPGPHARVRLDSHQGSLDSSTKLLARKNVLSGSFRMILRAEQNGSDIGWGLRALCATCRIPWSSQLRGGRRNTGIWYTTNVVVFDVHVCVYTYTFCAYLCVLYNIYIYTTYTCEYVYIQL